MFFKRTSDPVKDLENVDSRMAALNADMSATKDKADALETAAVAAVVDGGAVDFGAIGAVRSKLDAIRGALTILQQERVTMEFAARRAGAGVKRERATAKRAEAAAIVPKRDKLLAQLSALELVTYDATILANQHVGTWNPDIRVYDARIPVDLKNGFEFGFPESGLNPSVPAGQFARSQERVLVDEACALEDEADQIIRKLAEEGDPAAELEPAGRG
jgi:hypothetical protein